MYNYLEENRMDILSTELKKGDTGEFVTILQEQLKNLGYYESTITGSFDPYTESVVIRLQEENNLDPTGVVNPDLQRRLYEQTAMNPEPYATYQTRPTLRLGSTGDDVVQLQTLLTRLLYYNGTIDGKFGTGTQTAVKAFQMNNRLTPDGIVGRDTWSALESLYSPLAICDDENGGTESFLYTVVAGDSLWTIARQFDTTVDAIKRLNNLTSDVIFVGQQLRIPGTNEGPSVPNYFIYTVIAGDSLWSLSQRFGTTVDELKRINQLTSNNLSIGQQLRIPTTGSTVRTYTVVAGDSLWSIARRFGTTVDELKRINQLISDNLSIGQQLQIP